MNTIENDLKSIHQVLLNNRIELAQRLDTLPGAYKVQMINALEHLCELDTYDFTIKPRTSFIFTEDDEELDDDQNEDFRTNVNEAVNDHTKNTQENNLRSTITDNFEENPELKENEQDIKGCGDIEEHIPSSRTNQLLKTANVQQRFLAKFLENYLVALMRYEQKYRTCKHTLKPLPFHIIVNGLAGSGKSYMISIIEQMLTDFCISESAIHNRPRRKKGLLKMAHTGKAALNILGWTIHTALGMVKVYFPPYSNLIIIINDRNPIILQHLTLPHHSNCIHFEISLEIYF